MLGFKQYILTSLSFLLGARMDSYLLQAVGQSYPLLVEKKDFFFDGDEELSLEKGAQKVFDLYGAPGAPLKEVVLSNYSPELGFVDALRYGQNYDPLNYGLQTKETYKYYELAADYLKQNNITVFDNILASPLEEFFYQRLYLLKKRLSLSTETQNVAFLNYLDYLKSDNLYIKQLELLFEKGSATFSSSIKKSLENNPPAQLTSACCKYSDYDKMRTNGAAVPWVEPDGNKPVEEAPPTKGQLANPYGVLFKYDLDDELDTYFDIPGIKEVFGQKYVDLVSDLNRIMNKLLQQTAPFNVPLEPDNVVFAMMESKDEQALKCHLCKRRIAVEETDYLNSKKSILWVIEEIYGKLDDDSLIGDYLNCKQFGYKSLRGAVEGGAIPGSPVTIDCKSVPEKVEDFNTINYSPADFDSGYQAIDPSSNYRKQDLIPKIEELNDIIDKNLISVIEGEQ